MKRPELLVPASSLEVLKVAVIYGADAVYIGGEAFGLRAKAKNFSKEDISAEYYSKLQYDFISCINKICKSLCDSEYPGT